MVKQIATIEATDQCCPSLLASPLDTDQAAELAVGFTALADPVRLRVLSMLAAAPKARSACVSWWSPSARANPPSPTT